MKDRIKHALFALTAAYIALLPQFYEIFNRETRFTILWDHRYHAAIATAVAVLAALYGVLYVVIYLKWSPSTNWRIARDAALVVVLLGILSRTTVSILDRSGFLHSSLGFLHTLTAKIAYYLVIPVAMIVLNPFVAKRAVRRLYSCLVPLSLIGLLWPLTFQTFDISAPPIPAGLARQLATGPSRGTTNVYIFLLDEWSYDRTFPGGKVLDDMPRLRSLLAQSTLYRQARSPGPTTAVSIPRLLFENNARFSSLPYEDVKAAALSRQRIEGPTLFSESPPGFFKMAIGFWIDYPSMLGTNVDFAVSIHQEAGTRTYALQTKSFLFSQLGWLRYVGLANPQKPLHPSLVWIFSQVQAHRWALATIDQMNQPVFAWIHYCLPHYPYVWNAKGLKKPFPAKPVDQTPENYRDNLRYLDRMIGEIVDALVRADKFESSILILTSDHAWRHDPAHSYAALPLEDGNPLSQVLHVPLIVKLPHQAAPVVIDTPFPTTGIGQIIRGALEQSRPGPVPM